jgi:uncharacterized protein (TIGR03083 family)
MPAALDFDRYLDVVGASARRLRAEAVEAGLDADVVTCPAWDGRALLAHQTMVHRWAAANLRGEETDGLPNQTEIRETVDDLVTYFEEGLDGLLQALRDAPDELKAMVFLNDAPPPKLFWARRQAHENTIHMVDALSARLRKLPTAADARIDRDVALDGIDELLAGFYTRGRSKLFDGTEFDVLVAPDDCDRRWSLHVAERMTTTAGEDGDPAITISGAADAVYLALWNRGDEITVTGDGTLMDRWRSVQRVRWS